MLVEAEWVHLAGLLEGSDLVSEVDLGFVFGFRLQIVGMGLFMESFPVAGINGMC